MKVNKIKLIPKMNVIVKLADNQLESFFKDTQTTFEAMENYFIPSKIRKNYSFNYAKDYEKNKSNLMVKTLNKNIEPDQYETKIFEYIQNRYS